MAQEIKKMFCPNCGAPIAFEENTEYTFCSHCGSQLHYHDDHLEVKLKFEERKLEHDETITKFNTQTKLANEDTKKMLMGVLILFGLFVYLGFMMVLMVGM